MKTSIYILHGWAIDPQNEAKWQEFRQLLEAENIETHFLALPGLTKPLDEVWTLDDYVRWLDKNLPKQKIILLGHSFGGQLATRFTSLKPTRVEKLILLDAAGIRNKKLIPVLKRSVFYLLAKLGKLLTKSDVAKKLLYKLARERDYLTAPPNMKKTMRNALKDEVRADLAKIKCPTLVIWGRNDSATPLWMGKFFHRHISNSQLKIIDGARHSPQFTHAKETVKLIKGFA